MRRDTAYLYRPHIFQLANNAYCHMRRTGQYVIQVSEESATADEIKVRGVVIEFKHVGPFMRVDVLESFP